MSENIVNCWNSIGVWGKEKPRCPVLASVIHCQNCDKYIEAGRKVLQREITVEYENENSQIVTASTRDTIDNSDTVSVMILRIGDEWFALPSGLCQMVTEDKPIHSIPHQRNNLIKGIVNISGEVQLCFSLGTLLGVKEGVDKPIIGHRGLYNCLIVLIQEGKRYVFPVSEFRGLHRYNKKELQSTPATIKNDTADFLIGVIGLDNLNIGCLDTNIVFNSLEKKIR